VGMLRLLMSEFYEHLKLYQSKVPMQLIKETIQDKYDGHHKVTIATGRLAAPFITELAAACMEVFPETEVEVVQIRNDFFGEKITVSGLITGQDMMAQLKGKNLGHEVAIPCNMLRMGEHVFLDDVTLEEAQKTLQAPIIIVKSGGQALLDAMLGVTE